MKKGLFLLYFILCLPSHLWGEGEEDSLIVSQTVFYDLLSLSEAEVAEKSGDEIYDALLNLDLKESIEVPNQVLNKFSPHQTHVLREKNILALPHIHQNTPIPQHDEYRHHGHGHGHEHGGGNSGPPDYIIFTIILSITISVLIFLVSSNYFRSQTKIAEYELVQTAIKNQQEIPLEFIKSRERSSDLKRAVVFILSGVGVMFALAIVPDVLPAELGLIPVIVGIGMLLTNKIMKRYD